MRSPHDSAEESQSSRVGRCPPAAASGMPRGRLPRVDATRDAAWEAAPMGHPPRGSAGTAVIAWGIGAVDPGKTCQSPALRGDEKGRGGAYNATPGSVLSRRPVTASGRHDSSSCRDASALVGKDDGKGAEVEKVTEERGGGELLVSSDSTLTPGDDRGGCGGGERGGRWRRCVEELDRKPRRTKERRTARGRKRTDPHHRRPTPTGLGFVPPAANVTQLGCRRRDIVGYGVVTKARKQYGVSRMKSRVARWTRRPKRRCAMEGSAASGAATPDAWSEGRWQPKAACSGPSPCLSSDGGRHDESTAEVLTSPLLLSSGSSPRSPSAPEAGANSP
ncbi:hypothetical protein THAOC_36938 [Thalassiosira oceanica]|uniref:Uncharacterized protein n=1 Tax=Thalassiosira oceanica TaxID=159749 RepID=K0R737_THAOC|nr:hypothetical protein THAOC_36938 [Thalassiosira oceanica]|eukprot:EJK44516.1 hypothetical protein THAOC_36938 [Thalassiosira oceanica]